MASAYSAAAPAITLVARAIASGPAVAWNATAGKFHIAYRASDNRIWLGTAQANGAFNNDWVQLPSGTTEAPAIAWNSTSNLVEIAVKSATGGQPVRGDHQCHPYPGVVQRLYTNRRNTQQRSWNSLESGSQKLQIAIRTANRVYVGNSAANGTGFSGWTQIATGGTQQAPAIAWNPVDHNVQVAVKGSNDNFVYVTNVSADASVFGAWTALTPGGTSASPGVSWNSSANKLELAVRGGSAFNANQVFTSTVDGNGSNFSGWIGLPVNVSTTASPAIAINPTLGTLNIFTRNAAGNIAEYISTP